MTFRLAVVVLECLIGFLAAAIFLLLVGLNQIWSAKDPRPQSEVDLETLKYYLLAAISAAAPLYIWWLLLPQAIPLLRNILAVCVFVFLLLVAMQIWLW